MRALVLALLVCFSMPLVSALAEPPAENVVLVTTDGLRWQELFTGAEERLIDKDIGGVESPVDIRQRFWADSPEDRRKLLMPFLWRVIAKEGQVIGNLSAESSVVCTNGRFFSYPGYNELLCGFGDSRIASNDPVPNENVSVLEWLNRRPDFNGRVAVFASWDRFTAILNARRSGLYINSGWVPLDSWSETDAAVTERLNQLARELPHTWNTVRYDAFTFRGALAYLKAKKPRVMYLSLGETDDWCHAGRYDLYLTSAHLVDDYLRELWTTLQSMPEYAGKTALLITTDHGRGSGPEGWKSHGVDYPGSQQMWMAAIGAGIPAKGVVEGVKATQAQTAATVAELLGLDFTTFDERIAAPLELTADVAGEKSGSK